VSNVPIIEQLKKLVDLQTIDETYFQFKEQMKEKPRNIESLRVAFEKKKTNFNALQEKLKATQLTRKQQELDLKTIEESIARGNTVLSQLKTNKEYTAKIGEIEGLKADKSILEEKILTLMDEADKLAKDLEKEKALVDQEEENFLEQKSKIEAESAEIKDRLAVIEGQRKQVMPGIDPNLLRRYERILEHKGGIAIVPVKNTVCGGCFMNVTQQKVNQMKMRKEIVECEMCSRILYLEDEV
jgi:uncharacterized protein